MRRVLSGSAAQSARFATLPPHQNLETLCLQTCLRHFQGPSSLWLCWDRSIWVGTELGCQIQVPNSPLTTNIRGSSVSTRLICALPVLLLFVYKSCVVSSETCEIATGLRQDLKSLAQDCDDKLPSKNFATLPFPRPQVLPHTTLHAAMRLPLIARLVWQSSKEPHQRPVQFASLAYETLALKSSSCQASTWHLVEPKTYT